LHGATVSSEAITEETDAGDACHVQIGTPFTEQKMMPATIALRDGNCLRARNDCGAAGLVSAAGELGETAGGVFLNLALVPLKCLGLEDWQIALSESQERCVHAVKPRKWREAQAIYRRYGLEATIIGVITGNGRFQMVYDEKLTNLFVATPLSGEVCLDVPFSYFDECPLPKLEVVQPPPRTRKVVFPKINLGNVAQMAERVVGHFDVCNQARAITQYDSTVQVMCTHILHFLVI
jgi:phosphoribosylformylglycinamidine synthase